MAKRQATLEDAARFKVPPLPRRARFEQMPLGQVLRVLPTVSDSKTMLDLMRARPELESAINRQYLDFITSRRRIPRRVTLKELTRLLSAVTIAYPRKRFPLEVLNQLYDREKAAIPALLLHGVRNETRSLWQVLPVRSSYALNLGQMAEGLRDIDQRVSEAARRERDSILRQIVASGRAANVVDAREFLANYIAGATIALQSSGRVNYAELQAVQDEAEQRLQHILTKRGFTKEMLDAQEVLDEYNLLAAEEEME